MAHHAPQTVDYSRQSHCTRSIAVAKHFDTSSLEIKQCASLKNPKKRSYLMKFKIKGSYTDDNLDSEPLKRETLLLFKFF